MPGWAAFWKGHTIPLKVSSVATCSQRRDTACSHREGKLILVLRKSPTAGTFLCTSMDYMRPHISLENLVSDMCADPGAVRIPSLGRLEQAYPLLLRIFLLMTNKTGFYQNSPWQTKRFWGFLCLQRCGEASPQEQGVPQRSSTGKSLCGMNDGFPVAMPKEPSLLAFP